MHFGNPAYKKVKDALISEIKSQYKESSPLDGPLECAVEIHLNRETWMKDWLKGEAPAKYTGTDIDNKFSTIFDLLKGAGVVHDDCQFVRGNIEKYFGREGDAASYGTRITIKKVSYGLD